MQGDTADQTQDLPGTKVFWGLPLINGTHSWMHARANKVDGEISDSPSSKEANKLSLVSLRPTITSL